MNMNPLLMALATGGMSAIPQLFHHHSGGQAGANWMQMAAGQPGQPVQPQPQPTMAGQPPNMNASQPPMNYQQMLAQALMSR